MEYQGIVTGIGDKDTNKNLIKPEYDAILNDFIIGRNTILEGLVLSGKNISAGTCILCGYRGIIDTPKELDTTAYVYGVFTLNSIYGGSGEDSFDIVGFSTELTTNVNPTEITSAGTYYLLLYENGVLSDELDGRRYLRYSTEAQNLLDGGIIAETATTPTETNELGEIETDLHLTQPNRVANTEYVHAQIEREIDYGETTFELKTERGLPFAKCTLQRKSRYVIGEVKQTRKVEVNEGWGDVLGQIPEGFIPTKTIYISISVQIGSGDYFLFVKCDTEGVISFDTEKDVSTQVTDFIENLYFGYECIKES